MSELGNARRRVLDCHTKCFGGAWGGFEACKGAIREFRIAIQNDLAGPEEGLRPARVPSVSFGLPYTK